MNKPLLSGLEIAKEKIRKLEDEILVLKHTEKINQVLLEISNAVATTRHLNDLYVSIHNALNHLIHAPNFYICLYDREDQFLRFPYAVDERDERIGDAIVLFEENSLTAEVILTQKSLFLNEAMLKYRQKKDKLKGALPKAWLGVPLKAREEVFGAIAIQSYTHAEAFTKKDMDLLILVSNQIALAIDRKQLQESITKSEERHRTLTEKSHDIIIRFDLEFKIHYANSAVNVLGLSPSKMMGRFLDDLDFPKPQVQFWKESIVKVFHTQTMNRIEFKISRGNWVDCLLCPEFGPDQDVISVVTFARDITQRKEAELHHANLDIINHIIIQNMDMESMLNHILDAMIQMFDCDRAWILFPCDPGAQYFELPFMRTRPEWYQKPGFQVEITPKAKIDLQEVLEAKEPVVYDPKSGRDIRSSIKEFYHIQSMMVMPVFPKLGTPWEVGLHQCSHTRIWKTSDQQLFKTICQRIGDGLSNLLLHRQLGQAKSYIDNIFDSMPSILMGVDPQGKITHWNQEAGLSTGVIAQDAIGSFFYDILPGTFPLLKSIQTAVDRKKVVEKTKQKQRIGSRIIIQNITVYPLTSQEVKGAVIRMDDVTEQMRLEEMMVQSEKMLSIGGLAAGMAHEINNPLAGMMQNAQVIESRLTRSIPANCSAAKKAGIDLEGLKSYLNDREILDKFNHINEAGQHAATIVSNMLSFAQKGEGKKKYENLMELLERTIILAKNEYHLKRRFDVKKIQVHIDGANGFPSVFCEGSKIQQVFLNIIKNGTEAMFDTGGTAPVQPEFKIAFSLDRAMAVIRISDNGPGMAPDLLKQVFDPFFTTKGPGKGTGLGLSISYFIVTEDHKGKMDLTSVPGEGACFVIRLPIHG